METFIFAHFQTLAFVFLVILFAANKWQDTRTIRTYRGTLEAERAQKRNAVQTAGRALEREAEYFNSLRRIGEAWKEYEEARTAEGAAFHLTRETQGRISPIDYATNAQRAREAWRKYKAAASLLGATIGTGIAPVRTSNPNRQVPIPEGTPEGGTIRKQERGWPFRSDALRDQAGREAGRPAPDGRSAQGETDEAGNARAGLH